MQKGSDKEKTPERESVRSWPETMDGGQQKKSIWSQPEGFQDREIERETDRDYLTSPSRLPLPESFQQVTPTKHKDPSDISTNDQTNDLLGWFFSRRCL